MNSTLFLSNFIKIIIKIFLILNSLIQIWSSNRKINNGYFANLIEIANKINSLNDDLIKSFISEEWKVFCNDKIQNWSNLFTRKLCYEEKNTNFFNNYFDNYYESTATKSIEQEKSNNENKESDESNKENNVLENVKFFL